LSWLLLVASLSGSHGALRLRLWRAIKALGAAVLRDGVYLAPDRPAVAASFGEHAAAITASGGSAFILTLPDLPAGDEPAILAMFDRSLQYARLRESLESALSAMSRMGETEARRTLRALNREFNAVEAIDFFPGAARDEVAAILQEIDAGVSARFSPEEPTPVHARLPQCDKADFESKTWATRARLWVDRVASAWLIRRFIDRQARFVWLKHADDRPAAAIGFDFDGAQFTHIDEFVTFEVLVRAFGLEHDVALMRLGALVHQLDVGVGRVPEAAGFEAVLTGARERCSGDDEFLDEIGKTLEHLYIAFSRTACDPAERP
jgi:hypothetical protein